ncbi:unnamed protein product [Paramecium primaurelia]|uniref:Nudix hydrolase domain-containing protein n=1 Tax=Paramecium primaurelia TaxID=5886 RepID=A0A8S1MDY3_PARPR|nr:unnamed protein product [Paramecium primaurelia]
MFQGKPSKILTLLLIHQNNQILLAMKKRGFGMGKYNGFGGKVEKNGESIYQAAIRETQEEGCITPTDAQFIGYIKMDYDCEKETLKVHIFRATHFDGQVKETEEMKPQWFDVAKIPYNQMWIDDQYWIPYLLENKCFSGYLQFEGHDKLIQADIKEVTNQELLSISEKESEITLQ